MFILENNKQVLPASQVARLLQIAPGQMEKGCRNRRCPRPRWSAGGVDYYDLGGVSQLARFLGIEIDVVPDDPLELQIGDDLFRVAVAPRLVARRYRRLQARLIGIVPAKLVLQTPDPEGSFIFSHARLFNSPVEVEESEHPDCCHYGAADSFLWGNDLVTGYACTRRHGLWLRHSWGFDSDRGSIIETTGAGKWMAYFGAILSHERAERFARRYVSDLDALSLPKTK